MVWSLGSNSILALQLDPLGHLWNLRGRVRLRAIFHVGKAMFRSGTPLARRTANFGLVASDSPKSPAAPCTCIVSAWASKCLPCHNFGANVYRGALQHMSLFAKLRMSSHLGTFVDNQSPRNVTATLPLIPQRLRCLARA